MRYLIFLSGKEYEQGSLQDHINYLKKWGGTPDFWVAKEHIADAIQAGEEIAREGYSNIIFDEEKDYSLIADFLAIELQDAA